MPIKPNIISSKKQFDDEQKKRRALYTDLRGVAGRVFAARDLLNTIRALKEEAPNELWITELQTSGLSGDESAGADAIDRGELILRGKVKPEQKEGVGNRYNYMESWKNKIQQWADASGQKLFTSGTIVSINTGAESADADAFSTAEFVFEVRFKYLPTSLQDVVSGEHADLIEQGEAADGP